MCCRSLKPADHVEALHSCAGEADMSTASASLALCPSHHAGQTRRSARLGPIAAASSVSPHHRGGDAVGTRVLSRRGIGIGGVLLLAAAPAAFAEESARPKPVDLGSGVKGVDLLPGDPSKSEASEGDAVRVLLKGRLFAKQGWVFTDDYKEGAGRDGLAQAHEYVVGSGTVIRGLEIGVVGMREGGVRRVVIPPAVSYQDKTQEPVPRDFSNRQRLYTTIFNPTRIANGEGDTLSTVVFDIELVRVVKRGSDMVS